jgi:release factor glutamine methyltransferase
MATAVASVREALVAAGDALAAAGVESPRLDAELLLAEATGVDRAVLAAEPERPVQPRPARAFGAMVRRRAQREPVAYILGRKGFRGIEVAVDRRALIPRPETELLAEVALELEPETVLDVGTGSGAVALAIAAELPSVRVTATDTSPVALELAAENARRLGLDRRVRLEEGTVPPRDAFDLVVANLPYVSDDGWDRLAPEITRYEPRAALVSGPDGFEAIRELIAVLGSRPDATPAAALEVGAGQAQDVATALGEAGFDDLDARADFAGHERVVLGRRR